MTDITRLGKVQWNLTPPTSFMKALLTEGWVSLLIPYPGNLFDNDFRFGFFANNRLLDFKDFSPEMWKAYSSIFNNEDDECDRVFPDGPILESPDQEYFDMFNEMLKETHQETVWARQHPELQDSEESEYVCLLYTSPSPRDRQKSRMPSSA